ncbi:MAG: hypothetical protein ACRDSP_03200 [Pseudonocardiaceae bacterium]
MPSRTSLIGTSVTSTNSNVVSPSPSRRAAGKQLDHERAEHPATGLRQA